MENREREKQTNEEWKATKKKEAEIEEKKHQQHMWEVIKVRDMQKEEFLKGLDGKKQ